MTQQSKEEVIKRIKELVKNPAMELEEKFSPNFWPILEDLWRCTFSEHEVDLESEYIEWDLMGQLDYQLEIDDLEDLIPVKINLESKVFAATLSYRSKVQRLSNLRVAQKSDYKKHFPLSYQNENEIAAASKQEEISKFNLRIDKIISERDILPDIWDLLANYLVNSSECFERRGNHGPEIWLSNWNELMEKKVLRIVNDCMVDIGYVEGKATQLMLFEFDFSTPICHMYPISDMEAKKYPRACVDNFQ